MKLVFIYPYFSGPYGGERHLINLANGLSELGEKISIYTHSADIYSRKSLGGKIGLHEISAIGSKGHGARTFLSFIFMLKLPFKCMESADFICAMGWQSAFGAALLKTFSGRMKKAKIAYFCLEPPRFLYDLEGEALPKNKLARLFAFPFFWIVRLIDRWAVRKADIIISNSAWTMDAVKAAYSMDSEIVFPGVEMERFSGMTKANARKRLSIDAEEKIYISVSKLHKRKRIDDAMGVFLEHSKNHHKKRFFIMGSGPDEKRLKGMAAERKIPGIEFLGEKNDAEIALYMIAADFFIFTAVSEPFGIAPLEAKVAGCSIIPKETGMPIMTWKEHSMEVKKILDGVYGRKHGKNL